MLRPRRQAGAVLAVILAGTLVAAAPATANQHAAPAKRRHKPFKPPRWMRGPIRHYVLTYEGSISSQGTRTTPIICPTFNGTLATAVTTDRQSATLHYRFKWQVIFGRYHGHVALVWRAHGRSGSGYDSYTSDTTSPPGCPPLAPDEVHKACAGPLRLEPIELFESRGHFSISSIDLFDDWRSHCTDGGSGDLEFVFPLVQPVRGSLAYTRAGIAKRRRFRGKVATTLDGTDSYGNPLPPPSDRNDVRASFTLKPGRG